MRDAAGAGPVVDGPIVAITDRSGFDESRHHGIGVALDAGGVVAFALGDPETPIYPRSSNKAMQADAMLRAGWNPTSEQLALACASHAGTERHIAVVRSTLAAAGLDPDDLANTAGLPLDEASAHALLVAGVTPAPLYMNCSGKHAGMLATCRANDWPVDTYLQFDHPLQQAIGSRITELTGAVVHIGIDGCGAPAHVMPLVGLARAFRTLAMERGRVWSAMSTHPELVSGHGRDATRLMQLVPELMAKDGAEGVFAAALPDGRAAAVKILDGDGRAAGVVLASLLQSVGVDVSPDDLDKPILGHGEPVGRVRSVVGGGV